jgi:hypothetical protein
MFSAYLAKRRVRKAVSADLTAELTRNLTDILAIRRLVERAAASEAERENAFAVAYQIACGMTFDRHELLAGTQTEMVRELDPHNTLGGIHEAMPRLLERLSRRNIVGAMASCECARFGANLFLAGVKVKYRGGANSFESAYMDGLAPAGSAPYEPPRPPSPDSYRMPVVGDRP